MGFTVHGSNSPNEWGRFTYVPAVTAVFNYTGFGLQVGVKLVPQITGWRPQPGNPSPPSSPSPSPPRIIPGNETLNITLSIPSKPPTAYFTYGGGGNPNPKGTVYVPYYNPQLGFLPDLIKGGGFLTAAFLDGGGDALQWIGANTYNIGQNIYTQSQVIANEVQAAAQAGSNWLIQHTQGIPVLNYLGRSEPTPSMR